MFAGCVNHMALSLADRATKSSVWSAVVLGISSAIVVVVAGSIRPTYDVISQEITKKCGVGDASGSI